MLPACSPSVGGYDYTTYDARQSYTVYHATATSVRTVTINNNNNSRQVAGGVIGAVTGGVIGSTMGRGPGNTLTTLGGALLGGAAGAGIGELSSKQVGLQITVQYENGSEEVIVQGKEPLIRAGERVRIIVGSDGTRRVEPEQP
jgi:outer membrane lipoprotein SlyB